MLKQGLGFTYKAHSFVGLKVLQMSFFFFAERRFYELPFVCASQSCLFLLCKASEIKTESNHSSTLWFSTW